LTGLAGQTGFDRFDRSRRSDVKKVLAAAAGAFDRLAKAWEDMHDGEER
jgi:hypothetical protein